MRLTIAVLIALVALFVVPVATVPASSDQRIRTKLIGFEEVPAVSTVARGEFRAKIKGDAIEYELSFNNLEAPVTQAHIHFGQFDVAGGISVWLCETAAPFLDPAGLAPKCPQSGTVTGIIRAANVVGPAGQGIAAGEFEELLRALRAGITYANVHSVKFGPGEIRGQILEPKRRGDK